MCDGKAGSNGLKRRAVKGNGGRMTELPRECLLRCWIAKPQSGNIQQRHTLGVWPWFLFCVWTWWVGRKPWQTPSRSRLRRRAQTLTADRLRQDWNKCNVWSGMIVQRTMNRRETCAFMRNDMWEGIKAMRICVWAVSKRMQRKTAADWSGGAGYGSCPNEESWVARGMTNCDSTRRALQV